MARQNPYIYDEKERQTYFKKNPYVKKPFYLTPVNIFVVLLPVAIASFLAFFALGLWGQGQEKTSNILIFFQGISYVMLIAFTTLTLAIYYIRDVNGKRYTEQEKGRVSNAIRLAYENNAFSELPHVNLIAQSPQNDSFEQYLFIFQVGNRFYKLITDMEVNKIISVEAYETYQDLLYSFNSQGAEQ